MTRRRLIVFVTVFLLLGMSAALSQAADEVPRMTIEKLKEMLGSPDLIILDVRAVMDWGLSKNKIQGALRQDPTMRAREWADKYGKDKTIVLYCA
jgi:rhodanese-related sulfurtransferase